MHRRKVRLTLLESTHRGWAWLFSPWQLAGVAAVAFSTYSIIVATSVPTVLPEDVIETLAQFIAPPKPEILISTTERLSLVGLGVQAGQESGEESEPVPEGSKPTEGGVGNEAAEQVVVAESEVAQEMPRTEVEVDSAATLDPSAVGPDYPKSMLERNIEGVVKAQFVVDSLGRVDTSTFRLLEPAESDFVAAVKAALPRMKYRPALFGGVPVPQLVQQAFGFKIRRVRADSSLDTVTVNLSNGRGPW